MRPIAATFDVPRVPALQAVQGAEVIATTAPDEIIEGHRVGALRDGASR